jgi:GT2 family glycosyltransferase
MIYVVMPVHDRLALTRACLDDLRAQDRDDIKTVVVDDGSTDGTADVLARHYPEVELLLGDGTLWWTGATNLGVMRALERASDDDYVLTLNNDTRFGGDYVSELVAAAEEHAPALVGSLAVDAARGVVVEGGVRVDWLTARKHVLARDLAYDDVVAWNPSPVAVDVLPGRGTLVPVSAYRRVGLYDAVRLPHYGADYELSVRAARDGYQLLVSYRATVRIDPSQTGLHAQSGWGAFLLGFVSRRSANELGHRWRYARLVRSGWWSVPYAACDTARVVVGGLRRRLQQP